MTEGEIVLTREWCRRRLDYFIQIAWYVLEPTTPLVWNWHLDVLCQHLQAQLTGGECQNLLINVPPGTMKPVHIDSAVVERKRGRIPLSAVSVGDEVLTHKGRFRTVKAVHEQGVLPTLTITTARGRELRLAPDHPVYTARGWVPAQNLTTKDTLAVVHPQEPCGAPELHPEEARLLGYLVGDGSVSEVSTSFTNADPATLEDFAKCAHAQGFTTSEAPVRNTQRISVRGGHQTTKSGVGPLRAWRKKHGLDGATSYTKAVPASIFGGSEDTVKNFLGAYWACDGGIDDRRDLPRAGRPGQTLRAVRIYACTVSEPLARGLQHLLARLGLSFSVAAKTRDLKTKRQGDTYTAWYLNAADQDTAAKFMHLLGPYIHHEKASRASGLVRNRFDGVLSPDAVVSISPSAPGECRCLTVAEDSSFTANDLAVHNSLVVGVFAPAWLWLHKPATRILAASGTPTVVSRDSRRCRELLQSPWYRAMAPGWELVWDQNEKLFFANDAGGYRRASGVGSAVTGDRVDWIIVDDPDDASKVTSPVYRAHVNEAWWRDAASNRVANVSKSHRTVVMQRLHQEDLAGYILDKEAGQWQHLLMRMVSEGPTAPTWLGWTDPRPPGEALHPERFPESFLENERKKGIAYWTGQHQQNPVPAGGNRFKREWWRWWAPVPVQSPRPTGCSSAPTVPWTPQGCEYIQSVDATFSGSATSDNVVVLMTAKQGPKWYILEVIAKPMSFTQTQAAIREQRKRWPRCYATVIERKANGEAIIETLSGELAGINGVTPIGGKEARATAIEPAVEAGDVHLPEGWSDAQAWCDEFAAFPLAAHDDRVDALSQVILWTRMREGGLQATRNLLSR